MHLRRMKRFPKLFQMSKIIHRLPKRPLVQTGGVPSSLPKPALWPVTFWFGIRLKHNLFLECGLPKHSKKNSYERTFIIVCILKKGSTQILSMIKRIGHFARTFTLVVVNVPTVYWMLDARSNPHNVAQSCRELVKDASSSSLKRMLNRLCVSEISEAERLRTSLTDG